MTKRAIPIVLLALSVIACVQQLRAGDLPASREDILRMLDATGMRQQSQRMRTMMLQQAKPMLSGGDGEHLTAKQRAKLQDINERMLADVMNAYPVSDALDDMVPIYQKHFTKSDVDAITAFYLSPSGQKFVEKMPEIMGEFMSALMPKVQARIKPIMDKYQKEMEGVTRTAEKPDEAAPKPKN